MKVALLAANADPGSAARRDRALGRRGWRVLRLAAELVANELAQPVALVREALASE